MYTYKYIIYSNNDVFICIHTWTHPCIYTYKYTIYSNNYVFMCIYAWTRLCMYTYKYIIYSNMCAYMCIHAGFRFFVQYKLQVMLSLESTVLPSSQKGIWIYIHVCIIIQHKIKNWINFIQDDLQIVLQLSLFWCPFLQKVCIYYIQICVCTSIMFPFSSNDMFENMYMHMST